MCYENMTTENYHSIHSVYVQLTNRPVDYDVRKFFAWQAWQAKGWTEADLRLVVSFILRRIKEHKRWPESLRFKHLIEDHDRFADDLIDARAMQRKPQPTPRTAILAATHRQEQVRDGARSVGDILAGEKALRELLRVRDNL
jgi:hypothetical protein